MKERRTNDLHARPEGRRIILEKIFLVAWRGTAGRGAAGGVGPPDFVQDRARRGEYIYRYTYDTFNKWHHAKMEF